MKTKVNTRRDTLSICVPDFITLDRNCNCLENTPKFYKLRFKVIWTNKSRIRLATNKGHKEKRKYIMCRIWIYILLAWWFLRFINQTFRIKSLYHGDELITDDLAVMCFTLLQLQTSGQMQWAFHFWHVNLKGKNIH
jgi:hypothetical protein